MVSFKIIFTTNFIFGYVCCKIIIPNEGREFVTCMRTELFQLTGAEHRVTSAYHQQSIGLTERINETLQVTLMKLVNNKRSDWDKHLPAIILFSCQCISYCFT